MQVIDGDPDGIKICRVAGSTLVTIVIPRDFLAEAKSLPEIPKRGVYYLLDDNKGRLKKVYAGQTVQGIQRLEDHNQRKGWWNRAVMFLAPDAEFTMDIVSGLEAVAISYIREHGAYEVENSNDPKPYISPYSEAFIHSLHEDILFRMTLLGFDLDAVGDSTGGGEQKRFFTSRRGVRGIGVYNSEEGTFDVLEGSRIDLASVPGSPLSPNSRLSQARSDLLEEGLIVQQPDGTFALQTKVQFSSPSAAAEFVLGGSCNGWTEWKDESGQTLSKNYRE